MYGKHATFNKTRLTTGKSHIMQVPFPSASTRGRMERLIATTVELMGKESESSRDLLIFIGPCVSSPNLARRAYLIVLFIFTKL